jgi:TonB family protein
MGQQAISTKRFVAISGSLHLLLALLVLGALNFETKPKPKKRIKFKVIDRTKTKKKDLEISISSRTKPAPIKKIKPKKKVRKVYGVSRKSLTSKSTTAVSVKQGNTITKKVDNLKMTKDDVDELPIPKAEYLVTQMPSVQVKAKINYPPSAKKIGLEGVVVLSVLIDEKGAVRDASVLEGLTDDMDAEALRAIKEYKFSPARIEQDAVAVKVRYAIKFILENS